MSKAFSFGRVKAGLVTLVGIAALVSAVPAAPQERTGQDPLEDPPNILVILTDDQRAKTLEVMPHTRRWFIGGGRKYPNAFATTPLCCPSRASIMTGRYVHNHGVTVNFGPELPQRWTLQRHLQNGGYKTAISGKYLNGWPLRRDPPHFDRWAIFRKGYYDVPWNVDGQEQEIEEYSTRFTAEKAVEFLFGFELEDDAPWYLYVAPFAPHTPFVSEERYEDAPVPEWRRNRAMRERDKSDKPRWVKTTNGGRKWTARHRARQLRTLMSVDDMVLLLRRTLDELGEGRNTLAFFLSDNGYLWGDHRLRAKKWPYTHSIGIPMYMRWPGHVKERSVDRRLAANIDVAPTAMDAANIDTGRAMDGRSLLSDESRKRLLLEYWRHPRKPKLRAWRALRTKRVHYIEYYSDRGRVIFKELYDLERDPWQLRNVLAGRRDKDDPSRARLRRLHRTLKRSRRCVGTECP